MKTMTSILRMAIYWEYREFQAARPGKANVGSYFNSEAPIKIKENNKIITDSKLTSEDLKKIVQALNIKISKKYRPSYNIKN